MNGNIPLVVVDSGHGGVDGGAVNGNFKEKDFTLKASKYIFDRLKDLGIPAVMTRDSDISLPKNERIAKVNEISDRDPRVILISNHINAGGGEGAEVVYGLRNDSSLANMILDNIGSYGQIKRKVYQRRLPENPSQDYYYIIRETSPRQSVLIEYGFIDNKKDLSKLQNNILDYSEGVVKALADYLGVKYTPPVSDGGNGIDNNDYYVVQRGDTLWSIARKVGVPVDELKILNNLANNTIYVGQKLRIASDDSPQMGENTYVVQKGDSLYAIARKFNTTVDDLVRMNNLTSLTLQIGQILKVPGINQEVYTVQKGDTLYSISRKFNTTVDKIINNNNLSNTILSIGQQLIIK